MRIKSNIGLAVGPVDENHWGQVLVTPTGYGIVEIADAAGQAQRQGARALSHLGEKLSHELASLTTVEGVVNEVWGPGVRSLIVLVPVGRVVYLVLRGSGGVYVKRGAELASLMHTEGAVSGEVREGDTILLVSHGFSRALTHADIAGVFDHLPASEVAEKLTILLHEKTGGEGSVALVFTVERFEQSEPVPESIAVRRLTETEKIHIPFRHDPKRRTRVAAIIVTSLFLVSVVAGIWKQTGAKKSEHVAIVLSDARHIFEEGVALLELNPVKGRERLAEAKSLLEPLVSQVNPRTKEGRDVRVLYSQVNDNLTQALQITEGTLALFYDMELMKKGARATSIALSDTSLAIADEAGATVYRLDIGTKKAEVVAGGAQLTGVSSVAMQGGVVYALTPGGIIATKLIDKKSERIIPTHDTWGRVSSLVSFGGNLYLLDTVKSRIWKYTAIEKGFSDIREYLNPDSLPDLSTATNMTIDGSVWAGTKKGAILRFVQGREETFFPKGVEPALGTDLVVYVTDVTKNLYVLDRSNSRVVILDKDSTYLAQYRFEASSTVNAMVVSEQEKKMLLVSGGKIYAIDLK